MPIANKKKIRKVFFYVNLFDMYLHIRERGCPRKTRSFKIFRKVRHKTLFYSICQLLMNDILVILTKKFLRF